jgi:methionyl-tRNA formyltransferase
MDKRIIFFGTPDFAVASLEALVKNNFNVVAVVTSLDNNKKFPDVKQCAINNNIPVLQPIKLKSLQFIEELKAYNADIQIVVAFKMLPEVIWNMPKMGTINLHGSLLPKYRGAAPINWAIINGEKITGVTVFKLKHEIDTGNILAKSEIPILDSDNFESLYNKMKIIGAGTLVNTIKNIFGGISNENPQKENEVSFAPKLFKHNTELIWIQTCIQIYNFVRGLNPYPTAWILLNDKLLKIFKIHF